MAFTLWEALFLTLAFYGCIGLVAVFALWILIKVWHRERRKDV